MKIGDYIRSKYGIAKCIRVIPIRENSFMYEFDKEVYEDVYFLTASELEKYKSSQNIIDLIEEGDYVNGIEVRDISYYGVPNSKTLLELDKWLGNGYKKIDNEDIKSIVTKEMFANAEYKVETN